MSDDPRLALSLRDVEKFLNDNDARMSWTLRDLEKFLIIPRSRALVVWKFPVLYPGAQQKCSPSD